MLTRCMGKQVKAYIDRHKNIWFVKCNNFELFSLFEKTRKDFIYLYNLIKQTDTKSALLFIEGFFDAEGCVKIIREKCRKTPSICLDITNTNFKILNLIKELLKTHLYIESKICIQKPKIRKRKIVYHLRIYKKESVKVFLDNIRTTKLKPEKIPYVEKWIKNWSTS